MADLLLQVEQTISSRCLLSDGEGIVVGVSGGLDSVVLLYLLNELRARHGWEVTVAHFNHRLRAEESLLDERFVRELAEEMGLRFVRDEGEVVREAARLHISIEMAARRLRHAFLARVANELGVRKVALGHQADDQVETFFLRLLRGAGGEGLAGMRYLSPSPADRRIMLVRPLLGIRRAQIAEYARQRGLRWREDRTNRETQHLRNRIRHELIPYLEASFQPALHRVIQRVAELVGAESDFVGQMARSYLEGGGSRFDELHVALQRRILYEQLLDLAPEPSYDIVEELRQRSNRPVMVRAGLRVWRDSSGRLHKETTAILRFSPDAVRVMLYGDRGQIEFGGLRIRWRIRQICRLRHLPPKRPTKEWFDAQMVGSQIIVRHWQPGDRIRLIGAPHEAKLQDIFTNARIPPEQRRRLVIACRADGTLFWVEGFRIGEVAKLRQETNIVLVWEWERLSQGPSDGQTEVSVVGDPALVAA